MFGNSDTDEEEHSVETIVEEARNDTVTAERLTQLKPGGLLSGEANRYLSDSPLIEHLDDNEQPHFIFHAQNKTVQKNGVSLQSVSPEGTASLVICFTENKLVLVAGKGDDDNCLRLEYENLIEYEVNTGVMKHRISLTNTNNDTYDVYISNFHDENDVLNLNEFLDEKEKDEFSSQSLDDNEKRDKENTSSQKLSSTRTTQQESISTGSNSPSSKPENEIFDLSSREFKSYIRNLLPYEFEHFVADVWEARGWTTEVTSGSNDRGIDITATNATNDKQLIQVKRYSEDNKVGSQEVRKYATLYQQEDDVDAVVIVTASSFTKQGRELAHDLDVKAIDSTRLYQIVNDINHLDAVEEDYQAQSSGVESSNTEPDSINFQDVEEDVMSILQDSSDLMGKIQKAAQYDGIEAEFARNGREQDLKQAVEMHEIWIDIIDQCFTLAERTRNLPADSLPDDYWTLIEIQIGIFESLGESLAQGLRYKEKLLNTRLLGSPIDIGEKQDLSSEELDISPMAQEDIDSLKRKQDEKITQAAEYIEEIQNLSEKRKRILSRYT